METFSVSFRKLLYKGKEFRSKLDHKTYYISDITDSIGLPKITVGYKEDQSGMNMDSVYEIYYDCDIYDNYRYVLYNREHFISMDAIAIINYIMLICNNELKGAE